MQCNMLMLSWVAGALPTSRYQALLCSASSVGYTALRQSLGSLLYPQHTILLTNVDIRVVAISTTDDDTPEAIPPPVVDVGKPVEEYDTMDPSFHDDLDVGEPYSLITRVEDYLHNDHALHKMLNNPSYYYASKGNTTHIPTCTKEVPRTNMSGEEYLAVETEFGKPIPSAAGDPRTYLAPVSNISQLPKGFFNGCYVVKGVDFSGMSCLHSLPSSLLTERTALETMSFLGLSRVTVIPFKMLTGCTSLKSVDFGMDKLKDIPANLLEGCSGLTNINLAPLINVVVISPRFLAGCTSLVDIDFTCMCSVKKLPVNFLSDLTGLKTVNFGGFGNVTVLPTNLLSGCTSLESVNLSPFHNVTAVHRGLLSGCTALKSVNFSGMVNVHDIPVDFLAHCTSLAELDMGGLISVDMINTPTVSTNIQSFGIGGPIDFQPKKPEIRRDNVVDSTTEPASESMSAFNLKKPVRQSGKTGAHTAISGQSVSPNGFGVSCASYTPTPTSPTTGDVGVAPTNPGVVFNPFKSKLDAPAGPFSFGVFGQTKHNGSTKASEAPPSPPATTSDDKLPASDKASIRFNPFTQPKVTTTSTALDNPYPSNGEVFLQSCTSLIRVHNVPPQLNPPPKGWEKDSETSWKRVKM